MSITDIQAIGFTDSLGTNNIMCLAGIDALQIHARKLLRQKHFKRENGSVKGPTLTQTQQNAFLPNTPKLSDIPTDEGSLQTNKKLRAVLGKIINRTSWSPASNHTSPRFDLTLNIPSLGRQRCLPSWGPRRTPWFFL